jgi:UDPglucose--hexose-1-phosphate uridylyltransferase
LNPLTGEWVLVSAGRTNRPWQGATGGAVTHDLPEHDPDCYLCPRNGRVGGEQNPDYERTFVFTNDFAALRPGTGRRIHTDGLMVAEGEEGTCRVICFSPRHDLTMARMTLEEIGIVIEMWQDQLEDLGPEHRWVQIFENRGEEMGASNPHPHGQIWAGSILPMEAAAEDDKQDRYFTEHRRTILEDYVAQEVGGERVVFENDQWLVVVPYWAVWPFETLVVPKRSVPRLTDLDLFQSQGLREALKQLLVRYDNLFEYPFPYSMGWHNAPFEGAGNHWTVHAHFYPPLLRSASVRKFMVGYELLGEAQRDITAEEAALRLRDLPGVHYTER